MVEFDVVLCKVRDVSLLFINVYYGRMAFFLDQNSGAIIKPSYEEEQQLGSIDTGNCKHFTRHVIEELNMSFVRLYAVRFEPRIRCAIYRLTIKDKTSYIAECYDGSSATYRYNVFTDFEDAMAFIYD